MMRRRTTVAVLAGVLLAGLVAVPGAPAGAQDISDLPRLGFEIDPNQGNVGDLVEGWVDTDDIQEHCLSREGFLDGNPLGGATGAIADFVDAIDIWALAIQDGDHPIPGDLTNQEWGETLTPIGLLVFALAGDPEAVDELYEELFVLTFVDPVTQEMLGDTGNFSPYTGEGEIVVPPLDPGLYALAAACVGLLPQEDLIAVGGAFDEMIVALHEWLTVEWPDGPPPLSFPPSDELVEFVTDAAAVWFPMVVGPMAVGIDFYCILQDDGYCATPPGPVGLIDDEVLDEFNGDQPSDDPPAVPDTEDPVDDASDLVAVHATPSFTG